MNNPLLDFAGIDYTFLMPLRTQFVVTLCVLAILSTPALAQMPPTTQEQVDGCVRVLRQGINPTRGSIDLAVLGSLRELADPSLKPLWLQLAQQDRWEAQVHATLALSELTPDSPVDAWMISQLKSEDAQRAVIATLLDRDALTPDQCRQLLDADVLEPVSELWLLSRLVSRGEHVELSTLREYAMLEDKDADLAGLASCLAEQIGDNALLDAHLTRISEMPKNMRDRHLIELFMAIEQYKLTKSLDWMMRVMEELPVDRVVKWQATRALLTLDPPRGVTVWKSRAAEVKGDGEWMRAVLLLLDAGDSVPADTYRLVPRENTLLKAMAELGEAISNHQSLAQPLMALIDLGHIGTAGWALGRAEKLPTDEARAVYLHVLEEVEAQRVGRDERAELAIAATELLYGIDPKTTLSHLQTLTDDSLTQEVMLIGLLRCKGDDIGAAARQLRRIGHSRADSLTLLLIAKHDENLSDAEKKQLGMIAAGGGQLATALQAQAAWLYLKHVGRIEQALNRIFTKS